MREGGGGERRNGREERRERVGELGRRGKEKRGRGEVWAEVG